jgi:hypothetical protein
LGKKKKKGDEGKEAFLPLLGWKEKGRGDFGGAMDFPLGLTFCFLSNLGEKLKVRKTQLANINRWRCVSRSIEICFLL